jgi:hypothetical protein
MAISLSKIWKWQLDLIREYAIVRARNFPCISLLAGQIIYYFIFGVLGACRQSPYKIKNSYGAALYGDPHSEHTKNR